MSSSRSGEAWDLGIDRIARPLAEGLATQARRDALTGLGRKHGLRVVWCRGQVSISVGDQQWQFDASNFDVIEQVLASAIRQAGAVGSAA